MSITSKNHYPKCQNKIKINKIKVNKWSLNSLQSFTSKLLKVVAAININNPVAQKNIKYKLDTQKSKQLITKLTNNIPQTTNVAAWINAETGIGPSIASGNHICNPNCVDFENAQSTTSSVKIVIK